MGGSESKPDSYSAPYHERGRSSSMSFRAFRDSYTDVTALQNDLRRAGLESSNLIIGIDFTKSNEWTGRDSFGGKCLHHLSPNPMELNPYEQAISIIGETLEKFDDDKLIPAYGFGCARTHDRGVFSFLPQDQPCNGFAHVQQRYRQLAPVTTLSGPTSFAPLIRHAMNIVKQSGGQYHILLIVADGQVTRPSDLPKHHLSEQEQETINAIVEACALPLSIVMVGVGDGPWDVMEQFDDNLPERAWDNFQFVPFSSTLAKAARSAPHGAPPAAVKATMEATFALHALMEIPDQFKEVSNNRLLGASNASRVYCKAVQRLDPPPTPVLQAPIPAAAMPPWQQQQQGVQQQQQYAGYGQPGGSFFYAQQQPADAMAVPGMGGYGAGGSGYFPAGPPPVQWSSSHPGLAPGMSLPPGYVMTAGGPMPAGSPGAAGIPGGHHMSPSQPLPGDGSWLCTRCTYVNPAAASSPPGKGATAAGGGGGQQQCGMCGGPRFGPAGAASLSAANGGGGSGDPTDFGNVSKSGAAAAATASGAAGAASSGTAEKELERMREAQNCLICMERPKNMAFQCGHTSCEECGKQLGVCHICRQLVVTRIKLY